MPDSFQGRLVGSGGLLPLRALSDGISQHGFQSSTSSRHALENTNVIKSPCIRRLTVAVRAALNSLRVVKPYVLSDIVLDWRPTALRTFTWEQSDARGG